MSGSPKEKLQSQVAPEEATEGREIYLADGRKVIVSETAGEQLVEIRNGSGMLEVRIRLTDAGPVLQMDAARLQLKATESVEIESARVEIRGTETLQLGGGKIEVQGEEDVNVEAKGEVRVVGKMIYLN